METTVFEQHLWNVSPMLAWLYHWQTLTGALLAVVAAIATLRTIRAQRDDDRAQRHDEQKRYESEKRNKARAARARLPGALSVTVEYCRRCVSFIEGDRKDQPKLDENAVSAMVAVIERCGEDVAIQLSELLSTYQVQSARLGSGKRMRGSPEYFQRLYDCADLYARADHLFEYARREADAVEIREPNQEERYRALKVAVSLPRYAMESEHYDKVFELRSWWD